MPPRLTEPQDCDDPLHIVALIAEKTNERYVIIYRPDRRTEAVQQLGRWAANADLSFTWAHAAVLANKIRRNREQPNP